LIRETKSDISEDIFCKHLLRSGFSPKKDLYKQYEKPVIINLGA